MLSICIYFSVLGSEKVNGLPLIISLMIGVAISSPSTIKEICLLRLSLVNFPNSLILSSLRKIVIEVGRFGFATISKLLMSFLLMENVGSSPQNAVDEINANASAKRMYFFIMV